jgi:hypothetical protein
MAMAAKRWGRYDDDRALKRAPRRTTDADDV